MLLDSSCVSRALSIIDETVFYETKNQEVFKAMLSLFEKSIPCDLQTVTDELRKSSKLDLVGGTVYLAELTQEVASPENIEFHARIILEKSLLRRMTERLTDLAARAYDPEADAFELIDEIERDVLSIANSKGNKAEKISDVVTQTLDRLESIHGSEQGVTGVASDFAKLDQITGGWQKSDLIIIAARPSMGKTAFALSVARNAAVNSDCTVAIFSLEMSSQQLVQRMLTSEAKIDAQAARTGRLQESDWPRLAKAAGTINECNIFIDDSAALTALELRAKCRRLHGEHGLDLVIVDYMQLMSGGKGGRGSREQEIASISRNLKALAKELDVPVISLAQLSRKVEERPDKRPMLSDLRESGSIEQDADMVMFIYRASRYGIAQDEDGNSTEGIAEIIIGKQRNGPIGKAVLSFVERHASFENMQTYSLDPEFTQPNNEDPF